MPQSSGPALRTVTPWSAARALSGGARIAQARRLRSGVVEQLFHDAGLTLPPYQLLLRAFKAEGRVEVWAGSARTGPLHHVTTYEICYASGKIGPKRREGDGQVPEGFYHISYSDADSAYHLAMAINYPNRSDRILGDPRAPGSAIMIHGDCVSIGCISLSDERDEELWLMVTSARRVGVTAEVHIFPTRALADLLASDGYPEHHPFWQNLKEGFDLFEKSHCLPKIHIEPDGRYRFEAGVP